MPAKTKKQKEAQQKKDKVEFKSLSAEMVNLIKEYGQPAVNRWISLQSRRRVLEKEIAQKKAQLEGLGE